MTQMCEDCIALIAQLPGNLRDTLPEIAAKFLENNKDMKFLEVHPIDKDYEKDTCLIHFAYLLGFLVGNLDVSNERMACLINSCSLVYDSGIKTGWAFRHSKNTRN